jgi:MFS family permease
MKQHQPFYAWVIWLLSALFMFYKYALEVSPSVMTSHLMGAFQIDGAELGNLAATYFYAYLLMQIPAGLLIDRFGPRVVTSLAIALCALGSILFAQATSLHVAEVGRFLTGAGAAFAVLNCLKLTANWFPSNRFALMAGLMMTVGMLGAVGGQAPLSAFIKALGWRPAMNVIGIVGLVLAALFWLVVRNKAPDHYKDVRITPEKMRFLDTCRKIFSNPQSWWLSIYSGLAFAPVSVLGGLWGVPFITEAFNLSPTFAAHEISLIFIGFAVGAPLFGWFSDWLGKRRIVMGWGTVIGLACVCMVLYVPNLSPILLGVLLFFFGFSISSFLLCFTMIREISAPVIAATAIGFMNSFDALLGALSDPLTGKFLDMGWQGKLVEGARVFPVHVYKLALLALPAYLVIALILLVFIKETYCKPTDPSFLP